MLRLEESLRVEDSRADFGELASSVFDAELRRGELSVEDSRAAATSV